LDNNINQLKERIVKTKQNYEKYINYLKELGFDLKINKEAFYNNFSEIKTKKINL